MNGLQALALAAMNSRGGNQIGALQDQLHEFISALHSVATEGTGARCGISSHCQQGAHSDADEFAGLNAYEIGQGTVNAKNTMLLVVDDDEVRDGVEDFNPVAVGLVHAGEQTR